MKFLNEKELGKLSYQEKVKYYQKVKDFKFGNIKENTPLVIYYHSGRFNVFLYRVSGTRELDGFKHLVYGRNSSIGHLPTEVEIATVEEINKFIEIKREEFEKSLKYYESWKELL